VSLIRRSGWTVFVLVSVLLLLIGVSGPEGPTGANTPLGAFVSGDNSEAGLALKFRGTVDLPLAVVAALTLLASRPVSGATS
jgi:hypothetical protein